MCLLLVLLPDNVMLARLRHAVGSGRSTHAGLRIANATSWLELHHLALQSAPSLAVVDPYASGRFDLHQCSEFRRAFPADTLLPYVSCTRVRDVLRLASLGIREVVVRDQDDTPLSFRQLITAALESSAPDRVINDLKHLFPVQLLPLLHEMLLRANCPLRPAAVANLYHRHPNTVREHLRAAGLPTVNRLIVWTRLFLAAHLLESPSRTVEYVALALEFSSASALRNQLKRYAGLTPQDIREGGGLKLLLNAFQERHRHGRWMVASV